MPTLAEFVRRYAGGSGGDDADVEWLHLLVADWQLLADLSFADLLLWLPVATDGSWICVAQARPATGPTAHLDDTVGRVMPRGRRILVDRAWDERRICRQGDPEWRDDVPVREETVPVRRRDRVLGVVSRHTNLTGVRTPSRLELTYLRVATDLAQMISTGRFPRPGAAESGESPRVGDGLLRLDADGMVTYASPNAQSAYRRLGLTADLVGARLADVTLEFAAPTEPVDDVLGQVLAGRADAAIEVQGSGVIVRLRAIPLDPGGERVAALILARDVTELRRREQELLTKDATIREIHHRVKNNLQTVAALLRMQARRLGESGARPALDEAVRRVGSIAIVHETLSQSADETVDFDGIVERLLGMVGEVSAPDVSFVTRRDGSFGVLGAEVATPLALVLTELLQNTVEHGFAGARGRVGEVLVTADRVAGRLRVVVADDGVGLPAGFDPDSSGSLGLQIVRTLVVSELAGVLELAARPGGGTRAVVDLPAARYEGP